MLASDKHNTLLLWSREARTGGGDFKERTIAAKRTLKKHLPAAFHINQSYFAAVDLRKQPKNTECAI